MTLTSPLNNLPSPVSSFIGRIHEIAEIKQLLAANRLLTLTGPGGCGKTRLALKVASELASESESGVCLTEFAPLVDATLVPLAVATAVGVHEQRGTALIDTLAAHLLFQNVLLIFDNCEHLVDACAQLAETLLRACPQLRILATGREPLSVPGEIVWSVPPLSLPDPQPWRDSASRQSALPAYEQSEALRLFVARATAASPAFALTIENGAWVAAVCRHLDGMPLAIELAAARVRVLSVEQIAERLVEHNRFQLLNSGSRTAPSRHQTLAATLDWSFALLSELERTVLRRLSVFAGGWMLEMAEGVCAGEGVEAAGVLDSLAHLVDKSLVVADEHGRDTRYRMLETIREYALERLNESGEAAAIRRRHAQVILALAQRAARTDSKLNWPEQLHTVHQLEVEHDNLRAALAWSQSEPEGQEIGLRIAAAVAQFWQMRGYVSEGRAWLQTFLLQNSSAPAAARAEALFLAGYLLIYSDNIEQGAHFFERALALYQELGDGSGIAWQQTWLGWVAVAEGDYSLAVTLAEQAFGSQVALGDKYGAAVALWAPAEAAYLQGNLTQAASLYEQSLALMLEIGNRWSGGRRLTRLGQIAYRQGDPQRGLALIRQGMTYCAEGGDYSGIAMALAGMAGTVAADGDADRATRLLGAVAALQESTGAPLWFVDRLGYERLVGTLREQLQPAAFAAGWAEGRALALPQAIEYALALLPAPVPEPTPGRPAPKKEFGRLTAGERQAALLIAQGKSNREIAAEMVVGTRTVETYVTRILNKLGFDSRVRIATWVIEQGLSGPPPGSDT